MEFTVKTISTETVIPSSPTPSRLKIFKLSVMDQIFPAFPTPSILFYTADHKARTQHDQDLGAILKTSLSETLVKFYPLAGRFSESTIDCNDEGIPFIETQVNCPLSTLRNPSSKLDLLTKLYPPIQLVIGTGVVIALQLNVFSCGGFAISWYHMHKALDGTSVGTFFKYWAAMAAKQRNKAQDDLITVLEPDYHAPVIAFPPCPSAKQFNAGHPPKSPEEGPRINVVGKTFIFRDVATSELKTKAASERVPKPTRFEVVSGFIWEQILKIRATKTDVTSSMSSLEDQDEGHAVMVLAADMRASCNPPLSKQSMGNIFHYAATRAEKRAPLPELVTGIHEAILSIKDKVVEFQGEKRVEAINAHWNDINSIVSGKKECTYKLVSGCKLGFDEVDFGFGKPKRVFASDGRTNPSLITFVHLTDYEGEDGNSIEAWVFLEEEVMQLLDANHDFLAFACPISLFG